MRTWILVDQLPQMAAYHPLLIFFLQNRATKNYWACFFSKLMDLTFLFKQSSWQYFQPYLLLFELHIFFSRSKKKCKTFLHTLFCCPKKTGRLCHYWGKKNGFWGGNWYVSLSAETVAVLGISRLQKVDWEVLGGKYLFHFTLSQYSWVSGYYYYT